MKKIVIISMLALALAFGSTASAFAASTQNYTIVAPKYQGDIYSGEKTVNARCDFGVRHKYSGGKKVRFVVCNTSKQAIGSSHTVAPGGRTAPLEDLWYNDTSSKRNIVVRMDAAVFNVVKILCEGTWVWNY